MKKKKPQQKKIELDPEVVSDLEVDGEDGDRLKGGMRSRDAACTVNYSSV